jgi:Ala-tRNA(Pro) deacylase
METTIGASAGPHAGLLDWLAARRIEYELHEHPLSYTARETARAEGVDPATFAKVVCVRTQDGRDAMLVLDATDHVDMVKARKALDAGHVRLMSEEEMAALAPDCAVGALPAVGALFALPTYADYAVREDPEISFNAGSHHFSVRVDRATWERSAEVIYADLAEDVDRRPAWSRS